MNIDQWIPLVALAISLVALAHSILTGQAQARISLAERRNRIRLDVHDKALRLLSLIRGLMVEAQSQQQAQIIETLVQTSEGLVSVYRDLNSDQSTPWGIQTRAATFYDRMATDMQEFSRVLDKAEAAFSSRDFDKLEAIAQGLHQRIWGGNQVPAQQTAPADSPTEDG